MKASAKAPSINSAKYRYNVISPSYENKLVIPHRLNRVPTLMNSIDKANPRALSTVIEQDLENNETQDYHFVSSRPLDRQACRQHPVWA